MGKDAIEVMQLDCSLIYVTFPVFIYIDEARTAEENAERRIIFSRFVANQRCSLRHVPKIGADELSHSHAISRVSRATSEHDGFGRHEVIQQFRSVFESATCQNHRAIGGNSSELPIVLDNCSDNCAIGTACQFARSAAQLDLDTPLAHIAR